MNGTTKNGCKDGNKCQNWHATYICRQSVDSNLCTRPNCQYKHHRGCTTIESTYKDYSNNDFLVYNQNQRRPRQFQAPQKSTFRHAPTHQQPNYWNKMPTTPPYRQPWQLNQMAPLSEERLVHLIRTIISEEKRQH